jgi:acyl-CoA synthetase (AMP-forming)/AMP-acid ligase II
MKGYWKNEEETMRTIQNGWLQTGDMGTVDEYGNLDIVDRKKDVITSGGENISSIEVEGNLYEHPAVLEAAVIAVPHEKWGETPHAFIVVRPNHIVTESELGVIIRERRKKQGLTIAELSMMVPCSPRLLGELERGKRGVSVGIILQLLALLGLTVDIRGREESES